MKRNQGSCSMKYCPKFQQFDLDSLISMIDTQRKLLREQELGIEMSVLSLGSSSPETERSYEDSKIDSPESSYLDTTITMTKPPLHRSKHRHLAACEFNRQPSRLHLSKTKTRAAGTTTKHQVSGKSSRHSKIIVSSPEVVSVATPPPLCTTSQSPVQSRLSLIHPSAQNSCPPLPPPPSPTTAPIKVSPLQLTNDGSGEKHADLIRRKREEWIAQESAVTSIMLDFGCDRVYATRVHNHKKALEAKEELDFKRYVREKSKKRSSGLTTRAPPFQQQAHSGLAAVLGMDCVEGADFQTVDL